MDRQNVGNILKRLRKEKNETQEATAIAIGVSPSAYAMYETGQRTPRDDVKVAISEHFKKSVKYIFFS